jgi:hypothetical protein
MVSLSSVNVQLQQELDAARHEAKRVAVDNSRLRDQLQVFSAQETFLKAELEKVVARQQQLLSFERTPEGLGKVELLEHQNRELKDFVAKKEEELRTMQGRLQESLQRTHRLSAALATAEQQARDSNISHHGGNTSQSPRLSETPHAPDHMLQALMRHVPRLRQAQRDANISLQSWMALRHVMNTPHQGSSRPRFARHNNEEAPCALSQRHCAMQCLNLAARGDTHHHTGDSSDDFAHHLNRESTLTIVDNLLHELCEVVAQQQRVVVAGATEFLANAAEEEATALLDAAPVPEEHHYHTTQQNGSHSDEDFLTSPMEQQQLHVQAAKPPPQSQSKHVDVPRNVIQRVQPATQQRPLAQLAESSSGKAHQRTAVTPAQRSGPEQFSVPPAYAPQPSRRTDDTMQHGVHPEDAAESYHRSVEGPAPRMESTSSSRAASPEVKEAFATALYTIPPPRAHSAERPAEVRGSSNVIRVERSALRRSPIHRSTEGSPIRYDDELPDPPPSNAFQQQRPQHRPSIQPPRRGPAGGGPTAKPQASGEHYGGCDQQ